MFNMDLLALLIYINKNLRFRLRIPKSSFSYEYNLDKITTAYMDANGRYTNDYDKAINSFVNASTLVANYYDYKGNYFLDEEDAKYSMNSFGSMGIAYYEIEDPNNGEIVKINPLNKDDINKFKEIAYN